MDLRHIDLNLLVAFDVLITEKSVTAAARRLSVGQSAMSSTLSRLRALLDDPILERKGRAMVPTALAQSLTGPIKDALLRFDTILAGPPEFEPANDRRTFTVVASEYAALAVLQPLMVELRQAAPQVVLRIRPVTAHYEDELAGDTVDLAIVPDAISPTGGPFQTQQLYRDPYVIAVDDANPMVDDEMSLKLFSSLPYLAGSSGQSNTLVETQLDQMGIERNLEVTTGFGLAPFLLRDTLLVTLMPASLASTLAGGATLKLLPPPMDLAPMTESMVWADRKSHDPGHTWVRQKLVSVVAQRDWLTSNGEEQ